MPGLCPVKPFGVKGCILAHNGDHVAPPLGPKGWWGEIASFRAVRLACVIRFETTSLPGPPRFTPPSCCLGFGLGEGPCRRSVAGLPRWRYLWWEVLHPALCWTLTSLKLYVPWRTPVWLTVYVGGIGVGLPPRATFRSGFWGPMEGVLGLAGFA